MTKEEYNSILTTLVEAFPYNDSFDYLTNNHVDSTNVTEAIDKAFVLLHVQDVEHSIYDFISDIQYEHYEWDWDKIHNTKPTYDPEYAKVHDAFDSWAFKELYSWKDLVINKFVEINPKFRSNEDACKMAAEFWCERIFKFHWQDNGSKDYNNGIQEILGTHIQAMAQKDLTPEMKDAAYKGLYDFYMNSIINNDKLLQYETRLDVDYHPCSALYDILLKAGVPENKIDSICPWKTTLRIDARDNSILARDGYGKFKCI